MHDKDLKITSQQLINVTIKLYDLLPQVTIKSLIKYT